MKREIPLWIKICGITDDTGALAAQAAGADAIGFIFADSPRQISVPVARRISQLLKPSLARVGVFVDAPVNDMLAIIAEVGLTHVQLHGNETAATIEALRSSGVRVIKALRVRGDSVLDQLQQSTADIVLLDAYVPGRYGGTGRTFDWQLAQRAAALRPVILAGGLNPANVAEAVQLVRPLGVDVASGVERSPGVKDPVKVSSFVRLARQSWQTVVNREAAKHREVMGRVRNAT